MIKLRLKKDEKATTGKVFNIDINKDDAFSAISQAEGAAVANACALYGWRVYLQKDIAEAGGAGTGRDYTLLEKHLNEKGVSFTISEWVKGEKAIDPRMAKLEAAAAAKGITVDELLKELGLA